KTEKDAEQFSFCQQFHGLLRLLGRVPGAVRSVNACLVGGPAAPACSFPGDEPRRGRRQHTRVADWLRPLQIMRQFLLVLTTLVWMCSACHDDPPVVYPTTAPLDVNKLALGPGDKLNLTVFYGSHSFQAPYTLDGSGEISVQYIGAVAANGKTVEQVRDDIKT